MGITQEEPKVKSKTGGRLAGGNGLRPRAENDFYATNPVAVEKLLATGLFDKTQLILEPCVGMGHIANVLFQHGKDVVCADIVDRGYPNTAIGDYLQADQVPMFDAVITNPPFVLAQEFIEQSLGFVKQRGGLVAMFLKLAFLETQKRQALFKKYPPKYVYVFVNRMNTFRDGKELDEDGKPWATTMATAWFIWEKGFTGEPVIRWLN